MTVIEIARVTSRPGRGDEMAKQLRRGLAVVRADRGCHRATMFRGIEDPNTFVCEIEWTSIAAHEAWRDSPGLATYRGLVGDLEGMPIEFAHYELVFDK